MGLFCVCLLLLLVPLITRLVQENTLRYTYQISNPLYLGSPTYHKLTLTELFLSLIFLYYNYLRREGLTSV